MTDDLAVEGEQGAYVPCDEEAAPLVVEEEGAISGLASGFVAIDAESATLPVLEDAAIVGSGVGFVAKPCEEPDLPCGPFPYGPELQAVYQNLTPGTTSPLNTTAGTVTFEMDLVAGGSPGPGGPVPPGNSMTGNVPPGSGTVAEPPGFISPGNYAYRWTDFYTSTTLITVQPILRFAAVPGELVFDPIPGLTFEFRKNGVVLAQVIAHIVGSGLGPSGEVLPTGDGFYFAVADPVWVPETLCIETGDELSCWAIGDLSDLVSVDQGRIRLQPYEPPP